MTLHLVRPWREELDQIEGRFDTATTAATYEEADRQFYAVDRNLRVAWLDATWQEHGLSNRLYEIAPDPGPGLHLV